MPIARGRVRDEIVRVLEGRPDGVSASAIADEVQSALPRASASSIRSSLLHHEGGLFKRQERGVYRLNVRVARVSESPAPKRAEPQDYEYGKSRLIKADCMDWLGTAAKCSVHAVVTDPPYGLFEYSSAQIAKLREGRGGVWRIPPAFDGFRRSPLPRFTVLRNGQREALSQFFEDWATRLFPILVPGANVVVASNPLVSHLVASAVERAGFERRGELIRLTMTMRGGDRPKLAHLEYDGVSVMPRSMWEPWLLFRKPLQGRASDNLKRWGTGGFRRPSADVPFGDVVKSSPTRAAERALAPHPSLKPQLFLRQIVRGVLPLGRGVILDTFAGSGSTLAAAEYVGYGAIGIERDSQYFAMAKRAIPKLASLRTQIELSL